MIIVLSVQRFSPEGTPSGLEDAQSYSLVFFSKMLLLGWWMLAETPGKCNYNYVGHMLLWDFGKHHKHIWISQWWKQRAHTNPEDTVVTFTSLSAENSDVIKISPFYPHSMLFKIKRYSKTGPVLNPFTFPLIDLRKDICSWCLFLWALLKF